MTITVTAKELRAALEFCNPDGPNSPEQMNAMVTLWVRWDAEISDDGEIMPRGIYCYKTGPSGGENLLLREVPLMR